MIKRSICVFYFLFFTSMMLTGNIALAQASELKFVSNIAAVSEDGSTITIVVRGINVIVDINSDTRLEIEGDDFFLGDLEVGDSVEIEAYLIPGGRILAREIAVLDRSKEEFQFKGTVSDLDFSAAAPGDGTDQVVRITLLGVDVYINDDAEIIVRGEGRIGRGRSNISDFSDLDSYLDVGDRVTARGTDDGVALWVHKLKIGGRDDGEIEVEGRIQSLRPDGFTITVKDAGDFIVLIDANTRAKGALIAGALVKVEGMLTEDAAILAFEFATYSNDEENDDGQGPKRAVGKFDKK